MAWIIFEIVIGNVVGFIIMIKATIACNIVFIFVGLSIWILSGVVAFIMENRISAKKRQQKELVSQQIKTTPYMCNTETRIFHCLSCPYLKNADLTSRYSSYKTYTTCTYDNMISMGYKPCKKCKPYR